MIESDKALEAAHGGSVIIIEDKIRESRELERIFQKYGVSYNTWVDDAVRFRDALEVAVKQLREHVAVGSRYDEIALEKIERILSGEVG